MSSTASSRRAASKPAPYSSRSPLSFSADGIYLLFETCSVPLMAVAMTQMGKRYGLPVYVNVGLTDSKAVDAQAGLEIAASLLPGMLAGADIFGHMGICGVDQASSLPMLVLQDEVIGYLAHEHTVRHFRR